MKLHAFQVLSRCIEPMNQQGTGRGGIFFTAIIDKQNTYCKQKPRTPYLADSSVRLYRLTFSQFCNFAIHYDIGSNSIQILFITNNMFIVIRFPHPAT